MARPIIRTDIHAVFRGPRVLTLDQLGRRLSVSRRTVLRRLAEHGYFTSYNHRGRFLTIGEVAAFDSRGLWIWNDARFSEHGTLKQTAQRFIEAAERGLTHEELTEVLGVRVQNTLLDLVEEGVVARKKLGPTFVYVNVKPSVRQRQVRERSIFLEEHRKARPSIRQVIAVLVELIRDPKVCPKDMVVRCRQAGITVSEEIVAAVFETYDLDKKRAQSRSSTSSRRSAKRRPQH
jgi:DNA-binding transcriptional regulator YhcF (GntR family)